MTQELTTSTHCIISSVYSRRTMAGSSEITIIEEREELMISALGATDEIPTLRIAHFLNPTLSPFSNLPSLPNLPSSSLSLSSKPKLKVLFHGRPPPQREWKTWVEKLQPTHETLWRKVGIFDAIKASTYHIERDNKLVIRLAERWWPETNTFVFPWGEATVTLEDVMVLGGFPVVGESVLSFSSQRQNVEHLVGMLLNVVKQIRDEVDNSNITHAQWLKRFMGSGEDDEEVEHAAFLALWLSRYVFQHKSYMSMRMGVCSLAARLCSGIKIAFAPAVLAVIYRDLSLLKNKIVGSSQGDGVDSLVLVAPFQLVQLWAWERFPALAPVPRMLNHGEPRLARWGNLRKLDVDNLGEVLDSAGDTFRWRPYAISVGNWSFPGSRDNKGKWVFVGSGGEWETFARCLRVCRMVGLDCVEEYLPHRVAVQFGMDQDVPRSVPRSCETPEMTWSNYNRPLVGTKLYVPPRLFEGDVTVRYLNWWRGDGNAIQTYKRRKSTPSNLEGPMRSLKARMQENEASAVAPIVIKCSMSGTRKFDKDDEANPVEMLQVCQQQNGYSNPCHAISSPNLYDEPNLVQVSRVCHQQNGNRNLCQAISSPNLEDEQNPVEMLQICDKQNGNSKLCQAISSSILDDEQNPIKTAQLCDQQNGNRKHSLPISSPNVDGNASGEGNPPKEPLNEIVQYDVNDTKKMSSCNRVDQDCVTVSDDKEEDISCHLFESLTSELEARISKLESVVSGLSAAKRG